MKKVNEFLRKYTAYGLFVVLMLALGVVMLAGKVQAGETSKTTTKSPATTQSTASTVAQAPATTPKTSTDVTGVPATSVATTSAVAPAATTETSATVAETVTAPHKKMVTMSVEGLGDYKVEIKDGENSFDVLKRAADQNYFTLDYSMYTFDGVTSAFVNSIGGIANDYNASKYWTLYYNGEMSSVGASLVTLSDGDTVSWKYETLTW